MVGPHAALFSMKPIGWLVALGLVASTGRVVNFDSATPGKTPPGWSFATTNGGAAPRWEVRRDRSAPTPPYVLAQVSAGSAANCFPLALLNGVDFRDGDVSVRVKPVSGKEDRAGGLVFRYRDPENYYLARANAVEQNIALFKVENGRRFAIASAAKHDLPTEVWRILKVSVRGERIQVYVDHRRVLQAEDSSFRTPGKVGLWTAADSVTYFDDFRVNPR